MFERQQLGSSLEGGLKTFYPLQMYSNELVNTEVPFEEIQVGSYVFAYVQMVSKEEVCLKVKNSNAVISIDEFDIYDSKKNFKYARSNLGSNVLTKVIGKKDDCLILSRKDVLKETIEYLKTQVGKKILVTVKNFSFTSLDYPPYGIFVDLGNGVSSMLHVSNFTCTRVDDVRKFTNVGDVISVIIERFDEKNLHFSISRKSAYPKKFFNADDTFIVTCGNYVNDAYGNTDGIFVEYDPGNWGILDFPFSLTKNDFHLGDKVKVYVKSQNDSGFKAGFVGFC